MSGRDWKPGDVAMVEGEGSAWIGIVRVSASAGRPLEFAYGNGGFDYVNGVASGFTARPLVVIDPEDREQVERLAEAFWANWSGCDGSRSIGLQAALREFANPKPPRPDEPLGLGAVVEDEGGKRWVRTRADHHAPAWLEPLGPSRHHYTEIAVVRVLSEGIQP